VQDLKWMEKRVWEWRQQFTDANDGFLLMTMSVENKNNKKKEVTWYKCKKTGHYSNECGKEETFKTSNNHFIFVCLE